MIKKLFKRYVGLVTLLVNKYFSNPLSIARWKLGVSYVVIGAVIFIGVGVSVDSFTDSTIREIALLETGEPVENAFRIVQIQLWIGRVTMFLLFSIASYLLAEFAIRPIQRSSEKQRRFVANVSHELRTPLAVMRTSVDVALRKSEKLSKEESIKVITTLSSNIDRLGDIIKFLLIFADFENRRRTLELKPINFVAVVKQSINLLKLQAEEREIIVSYKGVEEALILGDKTALGEMVTNLLKNAIGYSKPGGRVVLSVIYTHQIIRFSVSDVGVGISPKDLKLIFEPYYRGGGGAGSGIGLGLSIAQEIAHIHGTKINVSSKSKKYTEFSVDFKVKFRS